MFRLRSLLARPPRDKDLNESVLPLLSFLLGVLGGPRRLPTPSHPRECGGRI